MEMFRAFDIEGTGMIDREDLFVAAKAMNWN
jgi:Ca2+-binding EF-hand superfamily protein